MKSLNFAGFKKKSSDGKKTTLEHKDGHTVTVIHAALSKEHRDQLESLPSASHEAHKEKNAEPHAKASKKTMMADGGKVPPKNDSPKIDPQKAKEVESGATQSGYQPERWKKNLKEGLGLAEGGTEEDAQPVADNASSMPKVDSAEKIVEDAAKAEVTPSNTPLSLDLNKPPQFTNPGLINPNPGEQFAANGVHPLPTAEQEANPAPQDPQQEQALAQTVQTKDEPFSPRAGLEKEIAGIKAESSARGEQGKKDAEVLKQSADDQIKFAADHVTRVKSITDFQDQMQKEINDGHIDPNRMWHNMSTGQKIASSIGLLLGGIGAGLSHGENLASKYIDQQIDRDIDAQKADLGKKENLLSASIRQFGNEQQGAEFARIMANDQVINSLKMNAAKATSPLAKAQAMQEIGKRELENADKINKFAFKQSIKDSMKRGGGISKMDPSTLVSAVVPEPHQKAVFGEIEAAQNTKRMSNDIIKSFDDAAKENTILKTGGGLLRTPASVYALHQAMQPTFKDLEGTVRQAAMDNTFKNITPMPGDLESTIETKRNALQGYLRSKASAPTAKGFGIDLSNFESTNTDPRSMMNKLSEVESKLTPQQKAFADYARKNPQNPRSAIFLKSIGLE